MKEYNWYLPSKDILNSMYESHISIGRFKDTVYWSSTEHSDDRAWDQHFLNGSCYKGYKYGVARIRAIRALPKNSLETKRIFMSGRQKYQAYDRDAPIMMNWYDALDYCKSLNKNE